MWVLAAAPPSWKTEALGMATVSLVLELAVRPFLITPFQTVRAPCPRMSRLRVVRALSACQLT